MPELGLQHLMQAGARDISPDSVIFSVDSNFTLFSSTTGCVDRCSFASDARDLEGSICCGPQIDLAGHLLCEASGSPASDPNKHDMHDSIYLSRNEKAKVHQADSSIAETEDEDLAFDLVATSFSQALKECQDRRSRSETLLKKSASPKTGSLDMKNTVTNVANRRQLNAQFLSCNNGRTLPSKWIDAERWIFSPISGDGAMRTSVQPPQALLKSKSGPLGPPVSALRSPASNKGKCVDLNASSPFSTGVMALDGSSIQYEGHSIGGALDARTDLSVTRSISVHGCPDFFCLSSLPVLQDERDSDKVVDTNISRIVATQMSSEGSPQSSPCRCSSSPTARSPILPNMEVQSYHSSKTDIKDVLVDERVTLTRWRKKHRIRIPRASLDIVDYWKSKAVGIHSNGWEVSETANSLSKVKREEARITSWENLQKAKAEAEIQKLEVKLQKKRSASMEKIMNKLRSAQKKAQEMRTSMLASPNQEFVRISDRALTLRRAYQISTFSGCFTCHAF